MAQKDATFSTGVKVVNVFATVRNRQGQIVRNLTKDDFSLDEDGQPQTIAYFAQESNLPLTLGLLVDTSGKPASPDRSGAQREFEISRAGFAGRQRPGVRDSF